MLVKENTSARAPLSAWWVACALAGGCVSLALLARLDAALPAPLPPDAPPHRFSGETAHRHLVNLTSIGPRVAGSYENNVVAVGAVVAALRAAARAASPHNRLDVDVFTAAGAFSLSFFDGLNNVYSGVVSVVARVRGAGGRAAGDAGARRSALLLNCHIDTVPDSPGASDDGAGCAVLLETLRALAATPAPLRHDAIFLFNGAEENIMQASHAFITQHKWAASVRAFINLEACGAGGREVLFQAGPRDPWLLETYASAVPHPYASSLAQELFESGLVPADTDFRIFRDFGNLSGLDLAWSANGYVYHTALDTAERVPPAALQRTGDNVLALTRALLAGGRLAMPPAPAAAPVYFDVLGAVCVCAGPAAAGLALLAAAGLVALELALTARLARTQLYVGAGGWTAEVGAAGVAWVAGAAAGLGAAVSVALALHAVGARLAFYSRPWLLAPMYGAPALGSAGAAAVAVARRAARGGAARRGWWPARAVHCAGSALALSAAAACAAAGLRSGFVPWLWALSAAGGAWAARGGRGSPAAAWALGAAPAALQTAYLGVGALRTLVPMAGRAGSGPLPADVAVAALTALVALGAGSWLLPPLVATRRAGRLLWPLVALSVAGALAALVAAPYSAEAPQRLLVLHTSRTVHGPAGPLQDSFFWIPELDGNTPHALFPYMAPLRAARALGGAECARWLYCGAPYFLPVAGLVPRSHRVPAPPPPAAPGPAPGPAPAAQLLHVSPRERLLRLQLGGGGGATHLVVVVAPAAGALVVRTSAGAAPLATRALWGGRRVYFFTLHLAPPPRNYSLDLSLQLEEGAPAPAGGDSWAQVSLAAHHMWGPRKVSPPLARLLAAAPAHLAAAGWTAHLHLLQL